jgi:hypothetical protein
MASAIARTDPMPDLPPQSGARPLGRTLLAGGVFAALTLIVFSDVLFAPGDVVLSTAGAGADLAHQYVAWRDFGFSELRRGNFALWNPYLYCGTPYFGGFQSGLLYPPNYAYLFLPLAKAINFGIALHIFLAGFFMYLWASRRRLHFLACLLCGALWMFCGEHYLHITAGHLCRLIATAWIPIIFLALDGLFEDRSPRWALLGIFAVSMMIFGGDPQYVFYTAVAAGIYCALCLVRAERRLRIALALLLMVAGAAGITAVQLWTGLEATGASVRGSSGVPYEFARMFSFPPRNFLTLLAPGFFGDVTHLRYWGLGYLWEMCLFLSVAGLLLAIYGTGAERARRRFSITMTLILLLLALGAHTPLFRLLYDCVPGFNRFRGMSKFAVQASAFIALLSGIGLDRLLRAATVDRRLAAAPVLLGAALLIAAAWISAPANSNGPSPGWWQMMRNVAAAQKMETRVPAGLYDNAAFAREAQGHAAHSLLLAALPCAFAAAGLLYLRSTRTLAFVVAIVAAGEMLLFALSIRPTFHLAESQPPGLKQFLEAHPGDYRMLILDNPDAAMSLHAYGFWGYAPLLSGRYAEFIYASQGRNPDTATSYLPDAFSYAPIYKMLRCRYVIERHDDPALKAGEFPNPMPHVTLIRQYAVAQGRDKILGAVLAPSFDPAKEVILESRPDPAPAPSGEPGRLKVTQPTTDSLAIEADLAQPAILLVTDNYDRAWRARGLPGSSRSRYEVMPADYTLRAIPLSAGHHAILMEYAPKGFRIGRWISIISAAAYLVALGLTVKNAKRKACPPEAGAN